MTGLGERTVEARLLTVQQQLATLLAELADPSDLVPRLIERVCRTLDWMYGALWRPEDEGYGLTCRVSWHAGDSWLDYFEEQSRKLVHHQGDPPLGLVWTSATPIWISDLPAAGMPRSQMAARAGLLTLIAMPVTVGGKVEAVLEFLCRERRERDPAMLEALDAVGSQLGSYLHRWRQDISDRRRDDEVAYLAFHDQLTGLPNRRLLQEHLEMAMALAIREQREIALLFLDLDEFKLVNDSFGHAAGDQLLQIVSERLKKVTRASDLLARHGGDEFLLLLTNVEGNARAVAENVAQKVLSVLDEPVHILEAEFHIGASVGISIHPRDAESPEELLMKADSAMYQAKAAGRHRYAFHDAMRDDARERLAASSRLRRALNSEEFVLHYQPIFTVEDRRIVALEALIRWQDPERGLLGPDLFIGLAEETGLIEPIGEWALCAVVEQARAWRAVGFGGHVSFNLSPRQLRNPRSADMIVSVLRYADLASDTLMAEVTESVAMSEDRDGSALSSLAAEGLRLSIDDFGAGHSSLARLRDLPVEQLKIDRSFLRGVPGDGEAGAIVRAMIDLGGALDMAVVAEGVESSDQLAFLKSRGCPLAQGFYLGEPVPPAAVAPLLVANS